MGSKLIIISTLFIGLATIAFKVQDPHDLLFPEHFSEPIYNFQNNPLSSDKIELGRLLFYDPILSKDNSISCASCHSPYNAFAHTDHALSHGINDEIGTRNAPALFNLAWSESFMWDGAVNHLDVQALAPIEHPGEMGETINSVVLKLQNSSFYQNQFKKTFGSSSITGEKMLKALSQFQLSLISANSKYDRVQNEQEEFTSQETRGFNLYKSHCQTCHTNPYFTSHKFENNGLPVDTALNDRGKWSITKKPEDSLLFKVPSLRNLKYTYPYMHDGRFRTLRAVLDHYSSGIQSSATLSKELTNSIPLTSNEKTDLIAFLQTLNDEEFVFNPINKFPKTLINQLKNDN